jgi:hypothetical protein
MPFAQWGKSGAREASAFPIIAEIVPGQAKAREDVQTVPAGILGFSRIV